MQWIWGKNDQFKSFIEAFPEFGKGEFELAGEDLYPDWKKELSPNGTWEEFLLIYKDFVQWWNDNGSPSKPGFRLWKEFLPKRK